TTFYTPPGAPIGKFPTVAATANTIWPGQPGARHEVVNVGWLGNVKAYTGLGTFPLNAPTDSPPSLEADADSGFDQDPTNNHVAAVPDGTERLHAVDPPHALRHAHHAASGHELGREHAAWHARLPRPEGVQVRRDGGLLRRHHRAAERPQLRHARDVQAPADA